VLEACFPVGVGVHEFKYVVIVLVIVSMVADLAVRSYGSGVDGVDGGLVDGDGVFACEDSDV